MAHPLKTQKTVDKITMEDLKNKNLGFFMNYFSSLKIWDKFGMLQREIALYNRLAKEFGKIYIFTYGNKNELNYEKYLENNIVIVPKKIKIPDVIYEFLLPFIHWKSIKQCDILKTNQNSGTIAPAIAKFLYRKKFIERSGYIGSEAARLSKFPFYAKAYFWLAENFSYRLCDQAFIPTKENREILLKKYPYLKNKLIIMNNFIDTDLFKKEEKEKKYDIIYVARFDKDKNHKTLLEAAKKLNLKILFIGKGEEKENTKKLASSNNINLTIIERIPNDKLPEYYNSSKICVFPSLHEGNPKALLEAMSCELPIVACDVVGVNNLIVHKKNGLLSAPDSLKIRENILQLLGDGLLMQNMGKAARDNIVENYSLDKVFAQEINIYKNI